LYAGQEDQIALRQGRRFVSRLQPVSLPPAPPLALSADVAYWVVGGSGALGQQVLKSFYAAGARQLIVSGRQAQMPPALVGLNVHYVAADIADPVQVQRVLATIDSLGLVLGGVVHAAGNASEYSIDQLTAERFREVAESKVRGAWNLHVHTLGRPLQFFVCFASIAGLWGSSAQAHYAAANHFLDALCEYRRHQQLPALAIDWGPWAGGGLVSAEFEGRLKLAGLNLLQPDAAMAVFGQLLGSSLTRIAAVDVRWPEFAAAFTARRESPLLSPMLPKQVAVEAAVVLDGEPKHVLLEIQRRVSAAVADQLGSGRQADAMRGFFDQGLDSLSVVAIHKRLVAELGISFPRPDMFSYATVTALSEHLLSLWQKEHAGATALPVEAESAEADTSKVLSSSEIAAAIEAEMAALGLQD